MGQVYTDVPHMKILVDGVYVYTSVFKRHGADSDEYRIFRKLFGKRNPWLFTDKDLPAMKVAAVCCGSPFSDILYYLKKYPGLEVEAVIMADGWQGEHGRPLPEVSFKQHEEYGMIVR